MKNVRYGITSRAITTATKKLMDLPTRDYSAHVRAQQAQQLEAYLRKTIPPNAVHVDTGFEGSIPKYIRDSMQIPVKQILMVSATDPKEEFKISTKNLPKYGRREMVLSDLEYSAQRLRAPKIERWGKIGYSEDAPGFWARLAGAIGMK
jgi:hypothetical protein